MMKKFSIPLVALLLATNIHAGITWPKYIDNSRCLGGEDCGFAELGGLSSDIIFDEPINYFDKNNRFHKMIGVGHRVWFKWNIGGQNPSERLPLVTEWGEETPYVLLGLNNAWFTVQADKCKWNNNTDCVYSGQENATWSWSQVSRGISLSHEAVKGQGFTHFRYKLGFNPNTLSLGIDKSKIKNLSNGQLNMLARKLRMPSVMMTITLESDDGSVQSTTGTLMVSSPQIVKLNDRQCTLQFDPSSIDFGSLSVSTAQNGKIGVERVATLKLNCSGYNDTSIGRYISGSNVTHSVLSATLKAANEVQINGKTKIGLAKNPNKVAPNIYIEGDLNPDQECGTSSTTLEVGNLSPNPDSFGGVTDAISGSKQIYWRLCKQPGEVEGGQYSASATISIDFK